jgi:spermidine synthase
MKNHVCKAILKCLLLTAAIGLFVPGVSAADLGLGRIIHEKNSLYNSIFVYQSGSIVTLRFGKRPTLAIQSQMDLDNPHTHLLEYTRMTFCGLLYNSEPNSMLVLGLGGGVIPQEMRHYYPSIEIDVAEIDQAIPPIASQFFGFRTDDKVRVHVDDGRMFVKKQLRLKPVPRYDIIVLDAFNGDYIPFHLMTKEFLEELKGLLSDDGVVVANVFYTNRLFDAEFKTFIDVFGRCQVFFGNYSGNAMLASPGPAGAVLTVQEAVRKARVLQSKLGLSFDLAEVAQQLAPDEKPDPRAKALTDDLAPVNWLRNQRTR